ncbi:penicillin acylase family protein [Actinomadura sp. DC4]|uniref:penicillin acylase family protein n=1 Tax=Actinomadura sp. DC4 TaxID=3055069 RepID=UPI0025AFCE04|nr:penicillin acylase family protein [Actinomadura sp. DC4]MDN3359823.1 penicillin acylase family protein [Actinomadura sp. DC4]
MRLPPGLSITRDEYGVPSVDADTETLAWFGLGWAAAEDRLWQLEYDRRRAGGRWAEVAGAVALPADRLARRLRLADAAERDLAAMDPDTAGTFESYADGVNAQVRSAGPPPEHEAAEIGWQEWTPLDSVLAFKIRHVLMGVWQYKIARAVLRARFGDDAADALDPRPLPGMRVTVPPLGRVPDTALLAQARADVAEAAGHLGFLAEAEGGSNAWVLGPGRTATGRPLLVNDSHRALDAPNTYWQAHLRCPEFAVSGATFPGVPGFPHFGHNGRVGWAITNAAGDAQDLYVEHFRGGGTEVRTAGGWSPVAPRAERIAVRDGPEHVELCWATPNGPVVHGDPAGGEALALRWTATDRPCAQFGVLRRMLAARDVRALLDGQDGWVDPLNNLVAADVEGHIGYVLRGELPARESLAAAQVPVPGWERRHAWRGRVPFTAMPRVEDPAEGVIVTANNTVTAAEYPFVSYSMNDCYRAERIHELAASAGAAGFADMVAWQGDTVSVAARRWGSLLAGRGPYTGAAERARTALAAGGGDLTAESTVGHVHACFRRAVARRVLDASVGPETRSWLLDCGLPGVPVLLRRWFAALTWPRDDGAWPAAALGDDLLASALEAAWHEAGSRPWGEVHRTAARHPLHPVAGPVFDPPPAGIGGDNETIQNGAYGWREGTPFAITNLSVYRQVLDLSDLNASGWVIPGGASGRPGDPHGSDQLDAWRRHRLVPMRPAWGSP